MRHVRRRDPRAMVIDKEVQTARYDLVCHDNRGSRGRILRGIFQYMSKCRGHETRIDVHGPVVRVIDDPDLVRTQCVLNLTSGHLHNLRRMNPLQRRRDRTGIDAGHLENVLKEPGQPLESRHGDLDLAARVLSGGKTSRLYKRLVYDLQIAEDVSASQASGQLSSQFTIVATAQPTHTTDELRKAIDEELSNLVSGGITPDEVARAKTGEMSSLVFELERDGSRANRINSYNQLAGDPAYLATDLGRYAQATPEAIVAAVKRYLPLDRRIVAVVTPKKGAPLAGALASDPSQAGTSGGGPR